MNRLYTTAYLLFFALYAAVNRLHIWLGLPPVSIHQWRQADGAATAWHYTRNPDFWTPSIFNLFYTGDAHAVGEWPLLYWLAGVYTRYLDWPAYPLRWIGLLLLFAGGWAFGWVCLRRSGSALLAVLCTALLLSAPVLCYYGPSTLPDAPAFCMILLMLACVYRAEEVQRPGWLIAAAFCATAGVLFKISMAILPLALASSWGCLRLQQRWRADTLMAGRWPLYAVVLCTALVLAGRWWISAYQAQHHAIYFLSATRPVWNYDAEYILETIRLAARNGLPAFGSAGLYLAALAGAVWLLRGWKKTDAGIRLVLGLATAGALAYTVLWFRMLREHDYYLICLLPLPALFLLTGVEAALPVFREKKLALFLGLCLLAGLAHDRWLMDKRLQLAYRPGSVENLPPEAFLSDTTLTNAGIPAGARILCPQDPSPNISLLALQRPGWTAFNFGKRINADTLIKYRDNFGLSHLALRDSSAYSSLYQNFFPEKTTHVKGWYLFSAGRARR